MLEPLHEFSVLLDGEVFPTTLYPGSSRSLLGKEGQAVIFDSDRLSETPETTDFLFRIRNTGGTGIHKQPAEHGVFIRNLSVRLLDPTGAKPWESDASLGWILPSGRIVAVRDAKFMRARRKPGDPFSIEIIHDGTPKELWVDQPWGSPRGERQESLSALALPGGRMLAYRVIETTKPLFVELDDWTNLSNTKQEWINFLGPWAYLSEIPKRMAEWIESFANVGTRKVQGELIYSDLGKGASFISNYVQGPGRWATWNVDPEKDVRDMPDSYHKNPSVWPDHTWHDGHDNLHYELGLVALREFFRWDSLGDGWKAIWSWWAFCRFAQWACTSGLVWADPRRGGDNRLGWQWGEKSGRGTESVIFVGGYPGSFAITQQKLYTRNVIAANVLPYRTYQDALYLHRTGVLGMGEGDAGFGARDMFWIGHAKIHLHLVGVSVGTPDFMPKDEIRQSIQKVLSSRDPATGLWPNFDETPRGLTNVFETAQCCLFLMEAYSRGFDDTLLPEIDKISKTIRDLFVVETGTRYVLTKYQWTPDGIPGYVNNGTAKANCLDRTEFSRPYVAVVLGYHALLTGDAESKRLFAGICDTLGELSDWAPRISETTGTALHPLGKSQADKVVESEKVFDDAPPVRVPDWHAGLHYSAWWKVLSSTYMHADTIGTLRRELRLL